MGRMARPIRGIVDVAFFCLAWGVAAVAFSPLAGMILWAAGVLALLVVMVCERGDR
jgi:hypothetical protein